MSLLDNVKKVRGESTTGSSTTSISSSSSLLNKVKLSRGEEVKISEPIKFPEPEKKKNLLTKAQDFFFNKGFEQQQRQPTKTEPFKISGKLEGKDLTKDIDLGQSKTTDVITKQRAKEPKPVDLTPKKPTIQQNNQTKFQRLTQKLSDFVWSPTDEKAKSANIVAIQKVYENKGQQVPISFIKDNYDAVTKDLGIRGVPTTEEIAQLAMGVAILAGLIAEPIATIKGITGFALLGKGKETVVSSIKPGAKDFTDLLPYNTPDPIKRTFKVAEFVADLVLLKKLGSKSPKIKEKLTKDIFNKYEVKQVELSAKQVKDIFQTGKLTSAEQKALFGEVNTAEVAKKAMKEGITITPETLVELRDKPFWAKLKSFFGVSESKPVTLTSKPISFTIGGKEVKIDVKYTKTKLLGDGTYTPDEVLTKVIGTENQDTKGGKELIKQALKAKEAGADITVGEPLAKTYFQNMKTGEIRPIPESLEKKFSDLDNQGLAEGKDWHITSGLTQDKIDRGGFTIGEPADQTLAKTLEDSIIQPKTKVSPDKKAVKPTKTVTKKVEPTKTVKKTVPTPGKKVKEIKIPRNQLPVETKGGDIKISKLEARIKQSLGDLSKEQIKDMGLATHREVNKKDNIAKASKYVIENTEDAMKVLSGELDAPKGILKNSVFIAMQNLDVKDLDIATRLATLSSTRLGQELSILTEIDKNLPVNILSDIIKVRTKTISKRYGSKSTKSVVKAKVKRGRSMIKAKMNWDSILQEVRC